MRRMQRRSSKFGLAGTAPVGQIAAMRDEATERPGDDGPRLPLWWAVGGGALLLATAAAAPFYTQVMAGAIWAGQTIRALCGW